MKRSFSKVSKNGRTTIPKAVRQQLKIGDGDVLSFRWEEDRLILRNESDVERRLMHQIGLQLLEWHGCVDDGLV